MCHLSESRIKRINGLHGFFADVEIGIPKQSESGFSGFKDLQDDFVENLPLQRSAMYVAIIASAGRHVCRFRC